jgi:hypothetical protein
MADLKGMVGIVTGGLYRYRQGDGLGDVHAGAASVIGKSGEASRQTAGCKNRNIR